MKWPSRGRAETGFAIANDAMGYGSALMSPRPSHWTAPSAPPTIAAGGNKIMFIRLCLVAAAWIAAPVPASAQDFPNRTIHIVVAYAPGGTGDIVGRLIHAAPARGGGPGRDS